MEGVRRMSADGHLLSLLIDRNLEEITAKANRLGAVSIDIQPINLRDWFLENVSTERQLDVV
jgi:hypothetical protein